MLNKKTKIGIVALLIVICLGIVIIFENQAIVNSNLVALNMRQNNTQLVQSDVSYIHARLIGNDKGSSWFYWLFDVDTINVPSEITFMQLAKNLNVTEIYFQTDKDWHSEFGFTCEGSGYFSEVNFIYKVDPNYSWKDEP